MVPALLDRSHVAVISVHEDAQRRLGKRPVEDVSAMQRQHGDYAFG
jgi:hypothetical protein